MTSWAMAARLGVRTLVQNCRPYSRRVARNPVRMMNGEGTNEGPPDEILDPASAEDDFRTPEFLEMEKSRLPPGFPPFEKVGKDDSDLSRLAMDSVSSRKRHKSQLIMLEGRRLIQEAFDAKLKPKGLFFSRVGDVTSLQLPPLKCIFQKVTYDKLQRWSTVVTSPGLIGFFMMPDTSQFQSDTTYPFSIICDNVRDPGNLGSILRVAASAGCKKVFLTRGCVDLWNVKVLRAAMGAHFHLCIEDYLKWDEILNKIEPEACIMYADNNAKNMREHDEVVRDDVYQESSSRSGGPVDVTPSAASDSSNDVPTFPYYQVAYSKMNHLYLVVGGETEGLSEASFSLKESHKCFRVTIPMLNNVESLNVSSALAILTHEMKRQFVLYGDSDQPKPLEVTSTIPSV